MAHLPLPCRDGSRRPWGDEPGRNTQAMVPKPDDDPKLDDETDDEPDEEPDEEPDDEGDDEPEPGTLYFGEDDSRGCAPKLSTFETSRVPAPSAAFPGRPRGQSGWSLE
jgi:hypothetical protein